MEKNVKSKPSAVKTKVAKKHAQGLEKRKAIAGYIFISPFVIGFLAFMLKPICQSIYMSLCEVTAGPDGFTMKFAMFSQYKRSLLIDPDYNSRLVDELTQMGFQSIAIMVFSFFVALVLNQKFKGRAFIRAIFFLPVILASGVMIGVETDNALLSNISEMVKDSDTGTSITGAIKNILQTSGMGGSLFKKVFELVDAIYDVAISSGIQIIVFLSGLQTISESMYEAADIEGCTAWEKLWKITFPMISPIFLVNWIYTIVDFFMKTDNQVIKMITDTIIVKMNYGFASAMAWIYFAIVALVIAVTSFFISKGVYYYD